jgi:hypothetical protein
LLWQKIQNPAAVVEIPMIAAEITKRITRRHLQKAQPASREKKDLQAKVNPELKVPAAEAVKNKRSLVQKTNRFLYEEPVSLG